MKTKIPLTVTGMAWAVLIVAIWNLFRFGSALANWTMLQELAPRPGPWYIALTASFWTLACFAAWRAIRRRYIHAQGVYLLTLYGYAAWWWADRLFLQQPRTNGVFAVLVTALLLIDIAADFFNRRATIYFTKRETHEQTPSDQHPA
jgi:hypothetical protein